MFAAMLVQRPFQIQVSYFWSKATSHIQSQNNILAFLAAAEVAESVKRPELRSLE